jgi:hypothetical protein
LEISRLGEKYPELVGMFASARKYTPAKAELAGKTNIGDTGPIIWNRPGKANVEQKLIGFS